MLSPIKRRVSGKVPNLKRASHARMPTSSQHIPTDAKIPFTVPLESPTKSLNSTVLKADTKPYTSFKECEDAALSEIAAGCQTSFTHILLQSPSPYSFKLGVLYAAKLNWCDALKNLLTVIQALCPPNDKLETRKEHPMFIDYFKKYSGCDFTSKWTNKAYLEELALAKAVTDGFTQVVHIFLEFIDPNFGDLFETPFLFYVYENKDEASRRSCLHAILPNLKPSHKILDIVAENGDLSTLMCLAKKVNFLEDFFCVTAAETAIEHGHDELAKWIFCQPGLIPWEKYTPNLVYAATEAQNLDMLVTILHHVPKVNHHTIGLNVAIPLWEFLKDRDQDLYNKFAPHYPKGSARYVG